MNQETLAKDNMNLIHFALHQKKITKNNRFYDDYYSAALYGYARACKDFDETKGFQFSTFAMKYIFGEISHITTNYSRNKRRVIYNECSLNIPLNENLEIALEDTIPSDQPDIIDELDKADVIAKFNNMKFKNKELFIDWLNGMSYQSLGKKYNTSGQGATWRVRTIIKNLQEEFNK